MAQNWWEYLAAGVGTGVGAGMIISSSVLTAQLIISSGITPEIAIGGLTATAN